MSKTHTNNVTANGKHVAKWLAQRCARISPIPTCNDIMTEIRRKWPDYSVEDQIAMGRVAIAVLKRNEPEGYERFLSSNPEVKDRPAFAGEDDA